MMIQIKPLVDASTPKHLIAREINRKLKRQEESRELLKQIQIQTDPDVRRRLYLRFREVNEDLGIPTDSAEQLLGADAPALTVQAGAVNDPK